MRWLTVILKTQPTINTIHMCGICGKLNFDVGARVEPELVGAMLETIYHRGPDGYGTYISGQIGLGHRRLSIIDLAGGHQPLSNEDETIWIVFNGEIYNYQDLRRDLLTRGHVFRTQSDTEVIVHLYEEFGERCVERLRGMFAFAIWDEKKKQLFLARDRVGIKPLYYRLTRDSISFASEIKAILADPDVRPEILPAMIDRFLTYFYLPGEQTLFRDILKLPPGSYLVARDGRVKISKYWQLEYVESRRSLRQAQEELAELLHEAVRLHMISDVPVGFLLSGGVDSTALLGEAVGMSEHPLSSYTLGFTAPGIRDERPYARLAARTYGSEHHDMTITAKDFVDFMPKYVWHMEEPVCEPPAIALYYVSRLAKERVKVLISGEGGDEAFAGYPNYRNLLWFERLKTAFRPCPGLLAGGISFLGRALGSNRILKYGPLVNVPFESYYFSRTSSPFHFFNSQFKRLYSNDFGLLCDKADSANVARQFLGRANSGQDLVNKMLCIDTQTWLPDDLLLKADKMTMANSIELRVPLLDHTILEFAASLPGNYKVRGFTTKYLAKKTLERRVPKEILNRKKTGFPVPYESWLRVELSGWLRNVLLDRESLSRGYFDKSVLEWLLSENQRSGEYSKELFSLVTLELLHRAFLSPRKQVAAVTQ